MYSQKAFVEDSWQKMSEVLEHQMPNKSNSYIQRNGSWIALLLLFAGMGLGFGIFELTHSTQKVLTDRIIYKYLPSNPTHTLKVDHHNGLKTVEQFRTQHTISKVPLADSKEPVDVPFELKAKKQNTDGQQIDKIQDLVQSIDRTNVVDELPNETVQILNKKPSKEAKKIRQSIGINFGLNMFEHSMFGGYYGGLIAEYALSKRIYVQAGINYSILKKDGFIPFDHTLPNKSNGYSIEMSRMHYITMPISIAYQPIRYIRLASGMDVSYLAYNDARYGERIGNQPLSWKSTFVPGRDLPLEAMHKWDLGLSYAISIMPNDRWGIDLKYRMGISDFTNDEYFNFSQTDLNNYYQLSLKYYFLKNAN